MREVQAENVDASAKQRANRFGIAGRWTERGDDSRVSESR
jgi:hypothetical protein